MKKTRVVIFSMLALFLLVPIAVGAYVAKTDNSTYVAEGETIKGNFYAAGNLISVDGTVTGDVICAGKTININGVVEGDVICAGEMIIVNGEVGGSVRLAGKSMNINGKVGRGVMVFGESINLGMDATVEKDMLMAGVTGDIKGSIGGDLHGGAGSLILSGSVMGDLKMMLDNEKPIQLSKNAIVGGDLIYTSRGLADIASGANVQGKVTHKSPKIRDQKDYKSTVWGIIYSIFTYFVLGLVLVSLWKKELINITERMEKRVGPAFGWGAVALLLTPIIAILLLITIIGIPLAIILMLTWIIALIISQAIAGITLGRMFNNRYWKNKKNSLIWAMIIGVVFIKLICSIPFIGGFLSFVLILWSMGGLFMAVKESR